MREIACGPHVVVGSRKTSPGVLRSPCRFPLIHARGRFDFVKNRDVLSRSPGGGSLATRRFRWPLRGASPWYPPRGSYAPPATPPRGVEVPRSPRIRLAP